ncbi:MAG: type II toxin-antitoxin system VapC family toxin [Acidimicrobiaceae bacterium]|nr:type II toxin-antitoxin system VapC family toxin [Acidimicrobiaceae bacterium]MXZ98626.1 type II toxin-antitoxin system VapC family toxin [Acidimicrobiaceae bacterium]MYE95939.1 type II toxin-antitoxin system VapC family toxin [Acidimicrobiaceae bacterium]MYI53088.1 type II toxin-antitoxin system VapC family toxin [Acidimicrobiaceae bacterium]MYJ43697.1 type II toxin-antitoxin system VapC family toxin [Acidimicrobiaceae bacterium]
MIVVGASVLADFVADDGPGGTRARQVVSEAREVSIPDVADVETVAVLRKRLIGQTLTDNQFAAAIDDLASLPFRRYPSLPLLGRAYELRATVTVYDAVYVALAESLGCSLLTADARLARASGPRCKIQVLSPE